MSGVFDRYRKFLSSIEISRLPKQGLLTSLNVSRELRAKLTAESEMVRPVGPNTCIRIAQEILNAQKTD